jgi:hypothetical protein
VATTLPAETQTLYAELLDHLMAVQAQRSVGRLAGSFVAKSIKGEEYLYWQASQPGGRTRQFYLGKRTAALDRLVDRFVQTQAEAGPDLERVRRLAAQLRAGGANLTDGPTARVIRSLAEAGLFDAGAVLVGTQAFAVLGNVLGVRWQSGLRTHDVDLAGTRQVDIDVAVADVEADVPSVLQSLEMGFTPVPPLDPRQSSTSFKVRGQALRVDLLSPRRGRSEAPIFIRRFNASAQPLDYLDYLLEAPERAVVVDGGGALVNVPAPARLAFHKLLVAGLRAPAFQTKAAKDVTQGCELLSVLASERPGDVAIAWEALTGRGAKWASAARRGLALAAERQPALHQAIVRLLGRPATRAGR